MRIRVICFLAALVSLWSCKKESLENPITAGFLSFTTNGQTLPSAINISQKHVKFEVDRNVDIKKLVPEFTVPDGYNVYVNGIQQVSGSSIVDFSKPVTYELKDLSNRSATWQASAVPLKLKILIDASHDGGVWWFPQPSLTGGYDTSLYHQGKPFADLLRRKGFEVTELARGTELTDEMFFGNFIVIRANGFQTYTQNEIEVYSRLIGRGMNMVFFTDHKKNDPRDELEYLLGLEFKGIAYGKIATVKTHMITNNITSMDYIAGSVLVNAEQNPDVEILGWLGPNDYADLNFNGIKDNNEPTAPPVMGILTYPNTKVFFIGDMNGLEVRPQPFIDNLINWMSTGF
jgi:hypothetical protein